jgi:hypothetical protein
VAITGTVIASGDGWPDRFSPERQIILEAVGDIDEIIRERPLMGAELESLPLSADLVNVLIVGDSHSVDLANAVRYSSLSNHLAVSRIRLDSECFYKFADSEPIGLTRREIAECDNFLANVADDSRMDRADWVWLALRWKPQTLAGLSSYLDTAPAGLKDRLVIVGRTNEFTSVPKVMLRHGQIDGLEIALWRARDKKIDALNSKIEKLAQQHGVRYIDKAALVCSNSEQRCDALDDSGHALVWDYGHWTVEGAAWYGEKLARSNQLAFIFGDSES